MRKLSSGKDHQSATNTRIFEFCLYGEKEIYIIWQPTAVRAYATTKSLDKKAVVTQYLWKKSLTQQ